MSTTNAAPAPIIGEVPPTEKTYTQAEFVAAIESARKEEKSKLYADIERLQSQVSSLTTEKETLNQSFAKLTQEHTNLKATSDVVTKAKTPKGEIDVQALIEQVTARVETVAKESYGAKVASLEQQLTQVTGTLKQKELAEARSRLIAEAGGEAAIIPELVKGNTEEEIRASVAESKRIFDSAKARFQPTANPAPAGNPAAAPAPEATQPVYNPTPAPNVPPVPPAAPVADSSSGVLQQLPTQTRISQSDYAATRRSRLGSLQGRYAAR